MRRGRALAAVALGSVALGCADAGGELTAQGSQAVVAGEPSGPEQDGVVLLRAVLDGGGEVLCSASLVAPRLLITARHCVSYLSEGVFSCTVRGELIDNPEGGGRLGLHLPPENLEVYAGAPPRKLPLAHGQQIISTLSPTICTNDLAFVVLDTALDLPVVPLRLGRPAEVGEAGILVGYGLTKDDQLIDFRKQQRAQKRDLVIDGVGPDSVTDGVTTVAPRSLIIDGVSGCVGDSGGPLLAEATGALLGVYSLLEGQGCTALDVRHHLVHVPPFAELIDEAFAAAGETPTLESTGEPGGGAGGAADQSDGGAGVVTPLGGAGGAENEVTEPSVPSKPTSSSCAAYPGAPPAAHGALIVAALVLTAQRRRRRR